MQNGTSKNTISYYFQNRFSECLREKGIRDGIPTIEKIHELGSNPRQWQRILKNKEQPSLELAVRVAYDFNLSLFDLFIFKKK